MNPLDDLRRAWAEHRARVAAEDARLAAVDREIDAAQIAREAGGPKVLDCRCDSCEAAVAAVAARPAPIRLPVFHEDAPDRFALPSVWLGTEWDERFLSNAGAGMAW